MNKSKIDSHNVNHVFDRIKAAFELSSDVKLAEFLGIQSNTLSMQRKRGSADFGAIIDRCISLDLNWLFKGDVGQVTDKPNEFSASHDARVSAQGRYIAQLEHKLDQANSQNATLKAELQIAHRDIEMLKELIARTEKK
ncbi:MAG: helix-turn-helix domain containing protein [Balneolales bacterium]|nr:helix-turn-helix domain containing protein [Balneolales bacterium]